MLEGAGANVTLAESVPGALRPLAELDFGVLVSDIGMPDQDGYDLIRRLRTGDAAVRSRQIPALAVTAFSAPEDRHRALAAGFQENLPKPVNIHALVDAVARLAASNAEEPA